MGGFAMKEKIFCFLVVFGFRCKGVVVQNNSRKEKLDKMGSGLSKHLDIYALKHLSGAFCRIEELMSNVKLTTCWTLCQKCCQRVISLMILGHGMLLK
ncbi:hypothetical protein CK203_071702 [Vitis vinifera]|uniref:Secreted protein n=1 Tax=Vitis vinifera TaxID=29760 RepID=A0A438C360_VITVI|nr:hypothetical protein CK203_071702 [Vitis vinifera]